jgi:hypothetical protein
MKDLPHLLVITLLLFSSTINSQELVFGVKGGINYNTIGDLYHYGPNGGSGVTPTVDTFFKAEKEMGTQYGVFLTMYFNRFFIRPEASMTSLKNNYPLAFKVANWTQSKTDLNVLFGYSVYGNLSLYMGPGVSNIDEMELVGNEIKAATPFTYNTSTFNFSAGLLLDFYRFGVDIRYEYVTTLEEHLEIDMVRNPDFGGYGTNRGALVEYNPSRIILSVHINIFHKNFQEKRSRSKSDWRNHKQL